MVRIGIPVAVLADIQIAGVIFFTQIILHTVFVQLVKQHLQLAQGRVVLAALVNDALQMDSAYIAERNIV